MILRPPRSTRTDTLFPYTTLFRSDDREERSSDDPSVTAVRSGNRRPLPLTGAWRAAPYRARRQVRGRARRRTGAVRNRACGAPPTAPPAATAQASRMRRRPPAGEARAAAGSRGEIGRAHV